MKLTSSESKALEALLAKQKAKEPVTVKLNKGVLARITSSLERHHRAVVVLGNSGNISVWGLDEYNDKVKHGKKLGSKNKTTHTAGDAHV